MNTRTVVFWIGLAAALLVASFFIGGRQTSGPPLDPASTGPLGTKGLTELLEDLGASVSLGPPTADTDVVLVLVDSLDDESRRQLQGWVEDGGGLVVADASSELSPAAVDLAPGDELLPGSCSIPALADVGAIEAPSFLQFDARLSGRLSCFGDESAAFVVAAERGSGTITSLGGALPLTNRHLDEADNAVLAARLLVPSAAPRIAVVYDPVIAAGQRSLTDLISTPVRWFGWQLLVAFGVFVFWKARRFGAVVEEPQLVELPGSLSVRASAELRRRAAAHSEAGRQIRDDFERRLRSELGLSPELPVGEVAATVSARTGVDPTLLSRALAADDVVDANGLAELVATIDAVAEAVFTLDPPNQDPASPAPSMEDVLQ